MMEDNIEVAPSNLAMLQHYTKSTKPEGADFFLQLNGHGYEYKAIDEASREINIVLRHGTHGNTPNMVR